MPHKYTHTIDAIHKPADGQELKTKCKQKKLYLLGFSVIAHLKLCQFQAQLLELVVGLLEIVVTLKLDGRLRRPTGTSGLIRIVGIDRLTISALSETN